MIKKPLLVVETSRNDFVDQVNVTSASISDQILRHPLRLGDTQIILWKLVKEFL